MLAPSLAIDVRDILPSQETLEDMARRRYQMPSVHKTDGKRPQWYVRYMVDVIVGPGITARREVTKYLGSCKEVGKREAEKLRDAILNTVNRPDVVIPSQVPFSHILKAYRESFIPGTKPNTQATYESAISRHIEPYFKDMRLCDIRKETVQAWIHSKRELSPERRRLLLRVMSSIWEQATDWEYTSGRNPTAKIKVADDGAGRRRDTRSLTVDEVRRLFATVDATHWTDLQVMVRIGFYCGLRAGEILALRWRDVRDGAIRVERSQSQGTREMVSPKSKSGRRPVPLPPDVRLPVRPAHAKETDTIWSISYQSIKHRFSELGKMAGLEWFGFGFHTLRHTYATLMEATGVALKDSMGHATESMSQAYVSRSFAETAKAQMRVAELVIGVQSSRGVTAQ